MLTEIALYEVMPDGKMLFPSWETAIDYIDAYVITDFKLIRRDDGKAVLEVYKEGGRNE